MEERIWYCLCSEWLFCVLCERGLKCFKSLPLFEQKNFHSHGPFSRLWHNEQVCILLKVKEKPYKKGMWFWLKTKDIYFAWWSKKQGLKKKIKLSLLGCSQAMHFRLKSLVFGFGAMSWWIMFWALPSASLSIQTTFPLTICVVFVGFCQLQTAACNLFMILLLIGLLMNMMVEGKGK